MKKIISIFFTCFIFLFSASDISAVNYKAYKFFLHGIFDLKANHIDAKIRNYEKVISLDKGALAAYKYLVYLYWQSGNADKALQTADKIKELDGEDPLTTNFLTMFYIDANKPDTAKQLLEKTIKLDPENEVVGHFNIGIVQERLAMNDAALNSYDKAYTVKLACKRSIYWESPYL